MAPQVVPVPLRWGDMDAQGHVNNVLFVDYLQEARAGFLAGSPNQHLVGGGVVVVGHSVEYRHPINFSSQPLQVTIGVVGVGASRFVLAYELVHDDEVCAVATSTLCPFDFDAQRPRRLTDAERDWFSGELGEPPQQRPLVAPRLRGRGHRHPVTVRWSDLDPYRHVNNVRFYDYVQEARIAMTTQADPATARAGSGPGSGMDGEQLWLVARQDMDYLAQMEHRAEPYQVVTAPVAIGTSSATFAAEVVDPLHDDGQADGQPGEPLVLARARTVLVCADAQGRPQPLAPQTRAALQEALVTGP